jgi:hypothetical protein
VGPRQRRHSRGGRPRPGCGDLPVLGRTAAAGRGLRPLGDGQSNSRPPRALSLEDRTTRQLAALQVRVQLRGPQMQEPELTSALSLFRRAANILSRLEDGIVFDGLFAPHQESRALFRREWRRPFRSFGKSRALYRTMVSMRPQLGRTNLLVSTRVRRATPLRARDAAWSPEWRRRSARSRAEANLAHMRSCWARTSSKLRKVLTHRLSCLRTASFPSWAEDRCFGLPRFCR